MSRPVLVTGGAGYIGSHTAKALAAAGYLPVTLDNLSRGFRDAVRWGPLEVGDVGDRGFLAEMFAQHRPSAVLHFAAFAYVGESVGEPGLYYRNNVGGSLALIEAAAAAGVNRFVFSSTCATYGMAERMPITEQTPQHPANPYGASKLMVERILADFSTAHGLRSVSLRYFNAAGADPVGEIGENHDPETHLIPLAIYAALGLGSPLRIFGTDWPTPDGTCIRDYIHVSDLARAHSAALAYLRQGGESATFNCGYGRGASVLEVIEAVRRACRHDFPVEISGRRAGDPAALVANVDRIRRTLDWRPQFQDLDMIVTHALAWERKLPGKREAVAG
jgi:UDP-arabinose 4-epimerase